MNINRIGIDLAKQVFQLHGVDRFEKVVVRKQLRRAQMHDFFKELPPCLIGMEACGSSHYWARELSKYGHQVKLIAAQFVKPYVKSGKNDANDAEAICEAVGRPSMRFVAIKDVDQQVTQAEHRIRLIRARTALSNEIRGLLGEFGIIIGLGISQIRQAIPILLMPRCWLCRKAPSRPIYTVQGTLCTKRCRRKDWPTPQLSVSISFNMSIYPPPHHRAACDQHRLPADSL